MTGFGRDLPVATELLHAVRWRIDPHKAGVLGFSAGGYLVAEISTDFKRRLYAPIDVADRESARPDFAMGIYPADRFADHALARAPIIPEP